MWIIAQEKESITDEPNKHKKKLLFWPLMHVPSMGGETGKDDGCLLGLGLGEWRLLFFHPISTTGTKGKERPSCLAYLVHTPQIGVFFRK